MIKQCPICNERFIFQECERNHFGAIISGRWRCLKGHQYKKESLTLDIPFNLWLIRLLKFKLIYFCSVMDYDVYRCDQYHFFVKIFDDSGRIEFGEIGVLEGYDEDGEPDVTMIELVNDRAHINYEGINKNIFRKFTDECQKAKVIAGGNYAGEDNDKRRALYQSAR